MGKKLIITSLGLFLITTVIIWMISYQRIDLYYKNITLVEEIKADNRLKDAESRLNELYNISKKEVLFLRDLIELDMQTGTALDITEQKLVRFLDIHENYFQARLINSQGMEIIRVEDRDTAFNDKFQYKGDRYYFREAIKLNRGEVYISHLDLNIENNEVEIPYRPTVRFFTPIDFDDKIKGIVGLNLSAKNWLKNFEGRNVGLLNSKGEVFYGNDQELYTVSKIDLNKKDDFGNAFYQFKKISLEGNHFWTIYTKPDILSIANKLTKYRKNTYGTALILTVGVILLLTIIYSFYQKNRYISSLNETVESRLYERDTLLKEIHHRVKNNLQVITSLLSLQSSFIADEEIKGLFRYSQYRINSMAIIHEMLYQSDNLSRIDYGAYVRQLASALIVSMKGGNANIDLKINAKDLYLNLDTSVPLGLMINEIITNSLKYGFKNRNTGMISIQFEKLKYPNFILYIGDDGHGFSDDLDFRNTKSLGLKLIHMLALQLKGNIEKDNKEKGTHYIITFQEIEQTS